MHYCNNEREGERMRESATEACMPCAAHNGVRVAMVTRGCGQARPIAKRQIYNIASNWPARHSRSAFAINTAVVPVRLSLGGPRCLRRKRKKKH